VTPVAIAALIALAVAVVVLAAAVGAGVATLVWRRSQRQATTISPDRNDSVPPARVDPDPATAATEADHESFGYIVSHDLRAPIRVVEGFTKIVKEDYGAMLDKVGHDHLDRILGAAARMNSMIDALLGLSRLSSQPIARVPVNLSQIAGFVIDDLRRQQPEREVEVEIEPALLTSGDPTLLRMMLENLLGNAWKYSGNATPARIGLRRRNGEATTFTVHDNGAGFDMRFADRLFGVFQRLHSASEFPGTGIGLASVRRIVRRHHGEIWAESEPDRGARFHFSLPLDPPRL
jgi:light-regulated signal transduction histidine kinase (bacteriophytochrome)